MRYEKGLPLKSKIAYGGLGAGISLPSQITFSAITFFYNAILGLSAGLTGFAWLIFSFWNAINDPIFGFIEDHMKSEKYGRRIPYIRFGAPLYGFAFIFCWIPFVSLTNQLALCFNLIVVLFVFDTLFTILGLINYTLPLILVFMMIFIFIFLFNKFIGKYGVKNTFISSLIITGLSFLLVFFIGWTLGLAIIGFILIGIGISGYMLSNQVVIADIVDFDEVRTGKRRETTYSGINALITKPAISIANWMFLIIINSFGFIEKQAIQTFTAQLGIMIGFSLIPSIFLIFGALVMFYYKLDGPKWLSQKEELIKIHEEKERNYLEYINHK